jgi:AraC-like DNA-binding protein
MDRRRPEKACNGILRRSNTPDFRKTSEFPCRRFRTCSGRVWEKRQAFDVRPLARAEATSVMHDELDLDPGSAAECSLPATHGQDLAVRNPVANSPVGHDAIRDAPRDRVWAQLRQASLSDFKEAVAAGDTARSLLLVNALAELALIEHSTVAAGSRRGMRALRGARLLLARRLIAQHLSQASLSAAMVAGQLGVSVRHLHMLFEGSGNSFSRYVTVERISLTGRLLHEAPERPVAEIARACGFESLATFYRVFHNAVGMPPGEFRAQSTPSRPAGPPLGDERGSANLTGK